MRFATPRQSLCKPQSKRPARGSFANLYFKRKESENQHLFRRNKDTKKTKLFSLIACVLIAVMLLSACGTTSTPPENRQAVFDSLNYLVMPPVIEDYALMSDIIGQYLSAAADGTMTVEEALNAAQADCVAQIKLG